MTVYNVSKALVKDEEYHMFHVGDDIHLVFNVNTPDQRVIIESIEFIKNNPQTIFYTPFHGVDKLIE